MDLFRRLLGYVKPYWKRLVGAMVCMVAYGATTVPEEQLRALVQLARAWIRGHRLDTRS